MLATGGGLVVGTGYEPPSARGRPFIVDFCAMNFGVTVRESLNFISSDSDPP